MSEIETLAATVSAVAKPVAKPKEIVVAAREKHPKASKKDVVRAAFYALTDGTSYDPERRKNLHGFGMSNELLSGLRKMDRARRLERLTASHLIG